MILLINLHLMKTHILLHIPDQPIPQIILGTRLMTTDNVNKFARLKPSVRSLVSLFFI